jgi:hypothetical protein
MLQSSSELASIGVTLAFLALSTAAAMGVVKGKLLSRKKAAWLLILVGVLTVTLFAVLIA